MTSQFVYERIRAPSQHYGPAIGHGMAWQSTAHECMRWMVSSEDSARPHELYTFSSTLATVHMTTE